MRVAVFTSNHPRHLALIDALGAAGHEVVATIEPKPWTHPDTPAMKDYWFKVDLAERVLFGSKSMVTVPAFVVPMGEASKLSWLPSEIFHADRWVVFGSSYIRGWLLEEAVNRHALNLHVGIAPEYRGSAPNFWAMYDKRHELVGAQVQALSPALDGGDILAEYRPDPSGSPWIRGMEAVTGGIREMVRMVGMDPKDWRAVRVNDPRQLIRYSKYADFTEEVVAEYLSRLP